MTISVSAFSLLVSIALTVTLIAPVVLVVLWVLDLKKGQLW